MWSGLCACVCVCSPRLGFGFSWFCCVRRSLLGAFCWSWCAALRLLGDGADGQCYSYADGGLGGIGNGQICAK